MLFYTTKKIQVENVCADQCSHSFCIDFASCIVRQRWFHRNCCLLFVRVAEEHNHHFISVLVCGADVLPVNGAGADIATFLPKSPLIKDIAGRVRAPEDVLPAHIDPTRQILSRSNEGCMACIMEFSSHHYHFL